MLTVPTRLEALLERDLGATSVALLPPGAKAPFEQSGAPTLSSEVARGHRVVIELADWPADMEAVARRLDLIVGSFRELLEAALGQAARPAPGEMLHRELCDLAAAAGAIDALVIDAHSEVVWSAARSEHLEPHVARPPAEVIALDGTRLSSLPPPPSPAERAVEVVRSLPATSAVARGMPLAHHERDGEVPFLVRSFATIYLLVVVFDAPFDEIRAEREVKARLEVVERLVLALPPIDPTPHRDAKAARHQG